MINLTEKISIHVEKMVFYKCDIELAIFKKYVEPSFKKDLSFLLIEGCEKTKWFDKYVTKLHEIKEKENKSFSFYITDLKGNQHLEFEKTSDDM